MTPDVILGTVLIVAGVFWLTIGRRAWDAYIARQEAADEAAAHRQQLLVKVSTPGPKDLDALIADLLNTPRVPQQRRPL